MDLNEMIILQNDGNENQDMSKTNITEQDEETEMSEQSDNINLRRSKHKIKKPAY